MSHFGVTVIWDVKLADSPECQLGLTLLHVGDPKKLLAGVEEQLTRWRKGFLWSATHFISLISPILEGDQVGSIAGGNAIW